MPVDLSLLNLPHSNNSIMKLIIQSQIALIYTELGTL